MAGGVSEVEPTSTEGSKPEEKLTLEARAAIERYMLKFVIPSGVVLTILSGLLGFVVSGLARIDASAEAAKVAVQAVQASAEAKANAAKAAEDARASQVKIASAASTAEETSKHLLSIKDQINNALTGKYAELAQSLYAIKDFRDSIQKIPIASHFVV